MSDSVVSTAERRQGRRLLLLAVPLAILSLAPLLWAATAALRPGSEVFASLSPFTWETIWPKTVTLDNYIGVLSGPFLAAMANSVLVTALVVAIGLVVSTLAAYAFAVLDFPGRSLLFGVTVLSFLIPFEAIAIPLAGTFRALDLQNTILGLVLPGIGNGLAIFLLRQFFLNVPYSLAEAARVDGASWFGILWRLYLPLSKGPMVGAGLILFVFQWQAYLWPLLIAPDPALQVAPVAIANYAQQLHVDFGRMFAGAVLTAAVPLVILLVFQRQFTSSLASTGSKE